MVERYVWPLFGIAGGKGSAGERQRAGRLQIEEAWLTGQFASEVQSRIQIDRLTGGVLPGALFDEKPAWGQGATWRLGCRLFEPKDYEIGLLLQLIKDLWSGDLPVGGGAGIGRGVLRGQQVTISLQQDGALERWQFRQVGDRLVFETGSPGRLNEYAAKLYEELTKND